MFWGEIFEGIASTFGLEAGVVIVGLGIIAFTTWNICSKSPLPRWVRFLLYIIGFVHLFIGLYYMLLKIGFDFFVEIQKLFTCRNLIFFSVLALIIVFIYYLINRNKYSIKVNVHPEPEQVYVNIFNDGKAEITCIAYLENIEEVGRGGKINKINPPSNLFLWHRNKPSVNLAVAGEGKFWILDTWGNEMCLFLGGSDNLQLEYGKKYKVSIGIYRLKQKSKKHLMKTINGEFCVRVTDTSHFNSSLSYLNTRSYKINWNQINEK